LTHSFPPDALVALARRLYGFSGVAWLCRVPARAFGAGERLSAVAEASAHTAARLLATTFSGPQLKDPDRLP
jgi:Ni,Fe-hydrogenase maturation factor